MPTTTRFSVAKTQKSYSAEGVAAIKGSTVKSETEQWTGGVAYPPSANTAQVPPTSCAYWASFGGPFFIIYFY